MAEDKKQSFTFSDKIKSSKPAVNPFTKRASKIGTNGKPKKTIFHRSRRDIPFFIAAALALLLLPFLYRYSGTVYDDGVLITPGAETVFDPYRDGLEASLEDPSGTIVQLTGRDPLDLIKGLGSAEEQKVEERDGFEDTWEEPRAASTRVEEREEPSVYRQSATRQVRSAIKREPTKINALDKAGLNTRGGGGLGTMFGGRELGAAARQNAGPRPRHGQKPVSLQPLRAADAPSRAYYGQGAAEQARASRAAMSKENAQEALRDAMFAPVENGRLGGLDGGGLLGGGAGGGKWDNHGEYKGITPWWWDMMKERDQEKWKWNYFLWRKNLVEPLIKGLAEMLVTIGKGIGCCLIMGKDNCETGKFFGVKAGSGDPAKCGKFTKAEWDNSKYKAEYGEFGEKSCKQLIGELGKDTTIEWHGSTEADRDLNMGQVRIDCLGGLSLGKSNNAAELAERHGCQAINTSHNFELQTQGKAADWHVYHAVVAQNLIVVNGKKRSLCSGETWQYNKGARTGVAHTTTSGNQGVKQGQGDKASSTDRTNRHTAYRSENLRANRVSDECVIYVAKGRVFDYQTFRTNTEEMLEKIGAEGAFSSLRFDFIEGYAMKDPLTKGDKMPSMPMRYEEFETAFILNKDNSATSKNGGDVEKYNEVYPDGANGSGRGYKEKPRSYREVNYTLTDGVLRTNLGGEGKENAIRMNCPFSKFRITAEEIPTEYDVNGILSYKESVHGPKGQNINVTVDIICADGTVQKRTLATYRPSDKSGAASEADTPAATGAMTFEDAFPASESGNDAAAEQKKDEQQEPYKLITSAEAKAAIDECLNERHGEGYTAHWVARFKGETSEDDAQYGNREPAPPVIEIDNYCDDKPLDSKEPVVSDGVIHWGINPDNPDEECQFWRKCVQGKNFLYWHQYLNLEKCRPHHKNGHTPCDPEKTPYQMGTTPVPGTDDCYPWDPCVQHEDGSWWFDNKSKNPPMKYMTPDGEECEEMVKPCTEDLDLGLKEGTQDCHRYLKCNNGRYEQTPYEKGSDCNNQPPKVVPPPGDDRKPRTPQIVFWAPEVGIVPADPFEVDDRLTNKPTKDTEFGACKPVESALIITDTNGRTDSTVLQVMSDAKKLYDQKHKADMVTISQPVHGQITVSMLIDAMQVLGESGKQIPVNAVCALGKTIGYNSRDPHFPNQKGGPGMRDNMFGAYAAFMGADSSFHPTLYKTVDGKKVIDKRFYGCEHGKEVGSNNGAGYNYHYGHYNWNWRKVGGDELTVKQRKIIPVPNFNGRYGRDEYLRSLDAEYNGMWRGAPLAPLAIPFEFKDFPNATYKQSADTLNRDTYWKTYQAHHVFDEQPCDISDKTMSYDGVQQYIQALCTNGTDKKPQNGNITGKRAGANCPLLHSADSGNQPTR